MDVLRTPEERFGQVPDFPYRPGNLQIGEIRMSFIDEGERTGEPVLLLHGEPTWSFLYRKMIPVLTAGGFRAIAPDLIGFGRSDKPTRVADYSYQRHVDWVVAFLEALDLSNITLFCQDWGSLIGLRIVTEHEHRFSRIVVGNGFLPTADRPVPLAFKLWRAFARYSPWFPIGRIVSIGCVNKLTREEIAAYDAPFPSASFKAGTRAFPLLVPTHDSDPAVPANRAAWQRLGQWEKPFLTLFGANDPILGKADRPLQKHVPGARDQPHDRLRAGHFLQEDQGPLLARKIVDWIGSG